MKKQNVGFYIRFNNAGKVGMNIREMLNYSKFNNYNVEKIVVEQQSGMVDISDDFYSLIENPKIDIIVTPSLSCITRNAQNFVEIEKRIKTAKKSLVCVEDCVIE